MEYQELSQLRTLASHHQVLLFVKQGAPSLLLSGVLGIPTWDYMRNIATDNERLSMLKLIDQAEIVALPQLHYVFMMTTWPEVANHLHRLNVHRTGNLLLYFTTEKGSHLLPADR
jgi:hypothetical protein